MNMKTIRSLLALLLCAALCLGLAACTRGVAPEPTADPNEAEAVTDEASGEAPTVPVRVLTLNGTTGFGMASLMAKAEAGEAALNYSFGVESDPSVVTAALVSGECDIAALPTNAAAALYNKTEGKVQILALNTLGVLYLVSDGTVEVTSFADLDGQTVYVPAQNPSFIFEYLCKANGAEVTIDNTYAQPAELNAAVSSGEVALAVLPEPMVTVARAQNADLTVALDLTAEWDKVAEPGSLVQGCVVVRTEFAEANGDALAWFLKEYGASVELLTKDPAAAAQLIEQTGIFTKAAVAEKAVPNCNVCFITGDEMQKSMSAFLQIMFETAPQSIGGKLPGADFYYILP